jgi:hypothetical protein
MDWVKLNGTALARSAGRGPIAICVRYIFLGLSYYLPSRKLGGQKAGPMRNASSGDTLEWKPAIWIASRRNIGRGDRI